MTDDGRSMEGSIFFRLPLEIRQEIYRYFFLTCRRQATPEARRLGGFPTHSLQDTHSPNANWILVAPEKQSCSQHLCFQFTSGLISNLLRVNSAIRDEAQAFLYGHFVLCFSVWHSGPRASDFLRGLGHLATTQINHLAFIIRDHICRQWQNGGCKNLGVERSVEWIEGNQALVKSLPGLRNVTFEVQVTAYRPGPNFDWNETESSSYSSFDYEPVIENCLLIASPFRQMPGIQIRWIGEHHGAHISHLCSRRMIMSGG